MQEIIIPQNTGTQTGSLPSGYQKCVVPDSLPEKNRLDLFAEQVQAVVSKQIDIEQTIDKYKEEVKEYSQDIKRQTNRNIEIIGLFSSVLALLIINVNIITGASSFLSSILLIIGLTCSIAIFSILIHSFFNGETKTKFTKHFWIPLTILMVLVIVGVVAEVSDWKFNKEKPKQETTTANKGS